MEVQRSRGGQRARGVDVLSVSPALVGEAARVREPYLNAQSQEPLR